MAVLQEKTGFNNQSIIAGNCAQRALVHSLLLLGIPISEKKAHKKTGVSFLNAMINGTSEKDLKKGIRRCRCFPFEHTFDEWKATKDQIDEYLGSGMPVIIAINDCKHWMVLAGSAGDDSYYWVDSSDAGLYGSDPAREVRNWMDCEGEFYFIAVKPEDDSQLDRSIVAVFDQVYECFDDDDIAEYWGVYLEDVSDAFDSPKDNTDAISAAEFFDRYEKMFVDTIVQYYGELEKADVAYEVGNYRAVAECHRMSVSQERLPSAIMQITAAIALLF